MKKVFAFVVLYVALALSAIAGNPVSVTFPDFG